MPDMTREQLEAMDDTDLGLQVGRWLGGYTNDPSAWLTGDGMVQLMEFIKRRCGHMQINPNYHGWACSVSFGAVVEIDKTFSYTVAYCAPRALAIAFVLAMQEDKV